MLCQENQKRNNWYTTFEFSKEWEKSNHDKYLRCVNVLFPIYKALLAKELIKNLPENEKEKIYKDYYVTSYTLMTAQYTQNKLFPENTDANDLDTCLGNLL